ncbi:MAG: glutamate--tRNA ligase [Parvibaculaceae bacterium]|nr:glutamate--tRNA ligase [Parvibaculaceae bacterium]
MTVTVRFAPSPTGQLHVGNYRAALFNWLYAKKQGGKFILRLDDTDLERSTQEYADGIKADLAWAGLPHDELFRQSDRFDRYDLATAKLKEMGLLYACYETADELDRKRKRLQARGLPPVYDRAGKNLTEEERAALEAEGRKPHWRFLLDPEMVEWDDVIKGRTRADPKSLSDPILIRDDGSYLYTLPSVVDDIEMGVTLVMRGDDHTTNTGAQIQIFKALGAELPQFGHYSLLVDADGKPLSKRLRGELSLEAIREKGFEPLTLAAQLARLGTSHAPEPMLSMEEIANDFKLDAFGVSQVRFDLKDLERLNAGLMHLTPFETVKDRLAERNITDESFWDTVRANLTLFDGVAEWWHIIHGPVEPVIEDEDAEMIEQAAALLPEEPWDLQTWQAWTAEVKGATGRKGRGLFMPLRKALTGLHHGPELANLLPLIGRERVMTRLTGASD